MSYRTASSLLLGKLVAANMNTTADQAIAMASAKYRLSKVLVTDASTSLTLAAGGLYTAASKGGSAVVIAATVYSALTGSSKYLEPALAGTALTDILTGSSLYLSLTVAQGGAATATFWLFGEKLDG